MNVCQFVSEPSWKRYSIYHVFEATISTFSNAILPQETVKILLQIPVLVLWNRQYILKQKKQREICCCLCFSTCFDFTGTFSRFKISSLIDFTHL